MQKNTAIILSGGIGSRVGADIPKQYIEVLGKSIFEYSLKNFLCSNNIDIIVIVVEQQWLNYVMDVIAKDNNTEKRILYANPGETRQLSIFNGLKKLEETDSNINCVIIHDAARPLVSKKLIEDCISEIGEGYDGVMPVIPVKDTVYYSVDGKNIDNLLERNRLFAGQAPEAFKYTSYLKAHYNMSENDIKKINGSSELAYINGLKIKMIPGDPANYKITDTSDLERFKSSLK